ncbi:hypothetical protein CR51_13765 [Caballeronia megalochromosomata]|nr:hypothetical protein CR51_13765 [Caballeronia megalochromosomata]
MSTATAAAPDDPRAAGWYGKLPTLGDFASRRLPPGFIGAWDEWLAARLAQSRARLGDAWLPAYLTSPVWRFFTLHDALGAPRDDAARACWSGVVMPSVDSVGRYFPLTIAAPFDAAPACGDEFIALWDWLRDVEQIALAALRFDRPVAWLETRLADHAPPGIAHGETQPRAPGRFHAFSVWSAFPARSGEAPTRHALWIAPGLPDADLFVTLLTGGRS